jgi:hypothetical protein
MSYGPKKKPRTVECQGFFPLNKRRDGDGRETITNAQLPLDAD